MTSNELLEKWKEKVTNWQVQMVTTEIIERLAFTDNGKYCSDSPLHKTLAKYCQNVLY